MDNGFALAKKNTMCLKTSCSYTATRAIRCPVLATGNCRLERAEARRLRHGRTVCQSVSMDNILAFAEKTAMCSETTFTTALECHTPRGALKAPALPSLGVILLGVQAVCPRHCSR